MSPTEGHIFHSRLTHTLEVAQIGRRLAERLIERNSWDLLETMGGLDPDVVESACLAHDLGHPPFGHVAEAELQTILRDSHAQLLGGFEGNAQSFRIVTKLAIHTPPGPDLNANYLGLNLTRTTQNAMLKYPWERQESGKGSRKWSVYESEEPDFEWVRQGLFNLGTARTVEAEIMDWADDVAYAIHDVEDFFRAGIIPLDALCRTDSPLAPRFIDAVEGHRRNSPPDDTFSMAQLGQAFEAIMAFVRDVIGLTEPYNGSRDHRGRLRTMTSHLIGLYINAASLRDHRDDQRGWLEKEQTSHMQVIVLQALTRHLVINRPSLETQQHGLRLVIRGLFETYSMAAGDRATWRIFPRLYQEELERIARQEPDKNSSTTRMVVDLVSSMSEHEALSRYRMLTGQAPGSIMERI